MDLLEENLTHLNLEKMKNQDKHLVSCESLSFCVAKDKRSSH